MAPKAAPKAAPQGKAQQARKQLLGERWRSCAICSRPSPCKRDDITGLWLCPIDREMELFRRAHFRSRARTVGTPMLPEVAELLRMARIAQEDANEVAHRDFVQQRKQQQDKNKDDGNAAKGCGKGTTETSTAGGPMGGPGGPAGKGGSKGKAETADDISFLV